jgi:predicted ATPase/DNA-binding XRE family transcriptional regulator
MSASTSAFGEILRRLRTAVALSQEELAARSGLSTRGISDLERGVRRAPHLETVRLLADALGLAVDDRSALLAAARPSPRNGRDIPVTPDSKARLPHPLTRLVGRDVESAALRALLAQEDARFVTVTGPGGIGKTRLAIAVAAAMAHDFADGIVYIDLAPQTEGSLVIPIVASAFGVFETRSQRRFQALIDALGDKHLLLVLDNCERVLSAAPELSALLESCPRLSVFATSHEAFRLRGERDYSLAPLPVPDLNQLPPLSDLAKNPSVALFSTYARASDPTFTLTEENAETVATICRRLDGWPLAIELAAARVKMLPPEALLARLENRLPLLTGGRRDAPTRQRTLRNTIAWGYDLLSPVEQTLFRRLGVFVGGWTLDAAEAVVNFDQSVDVQQGVSSLFDKSLVRLLASGPNPRYGMLETIREFAVEQLKGTPDEAGVREAHVRYMLALASGTWWAFPERANVQDAREWLDQALTQPEHTSQEARALALGSAALSAFNQGDFNTAEHLAEASLELSRVGGFDHHTGLALYVLMIVRQEQGDYARSTAIGEQAIRHFRRSGDARWLSQALIDTGTSASLNGNVERATALREEGFALCRAIGNLVGLAQAMNDLGIEAADRGDTQLALAHYRNSLALMVEADEKVYIAHPLASMASMLLTEGQVEVTTRLLGTVAFTHETNRTFPWNTERERDKRIASLARAALGEVRFGAEFAAGRQVSVTEAARLALNAVDLVQAAALGDDRGRLSDLNC